MTERQSKILEAWNMFEEQEPDISTERLFAMVSDHTGAEIDEITDALYNSFLSRRELEFNHEL